MSNLIISSYDYMAIFCPGILLLLPLIRELKPTIECEWPIVLFFLFVSYFVGLAFHNLLEFLLKCIGVLKNKCLLLGAYQHVNNESHKCKQLKAIIQQKYDDCYYSLMKTGTLGVIPVLESQETFIRNFGTISIIYLIFNKYYLTDQIFNHCQCCACLICVIIFLISILLWFNVQRKVFIAVWDTSKHCLDKIDVDNKKCNNP